ncbi:unnamed protein product [Parascedosporium putredinis]|uniref:T6SS Phospholipase effector Tle1-like catalytic domain-containing protein n=1 Tax=Parascedosporium putredinis TaxID=1442378 RepID=A0A9P1GWC7_9PEZI|nr:unnamed protein product [Parascedosporium putredinis]CAI7988636.1 unnamed protein product [Parascedosporium putredinis]
MQLPCNTGNWQLRTAQIPIGPLNVTRISRSFKRLCDDGVMQIINYESGVGTGSNLLDSVTGGAFGVGLSERVREAYQFICANYCDGDEIVLIGYSRGAYTVRSVAGMIGEIGLLTREGMEMFYPIFKDMENWMDKGYKDQFPTIPLQTSPRELVLLSCTRLGLKSTYQFYDTNLSVQIEHAFQALALDETRPPFSPAVWERLPTNKLTTDLRQVWFPGNHGNIGGGWADQGVANITLAWMMDQLASVGVEFDEKSLEKIFNRQVEYYDTTAKESPSIKSTSSALYVLAGQKNRTPGVYRKTDPKTGLPTKEFLVDTNERIHPCVRVRLCCKGLGLNDSAVWDPEPLKKWKLKRVGAATATAANGNGKADAVVKVEALGGNEAWGPSKTEQEDIKDAGQWAWQYNGTEADAPPVKTLMEEKLGPYERYF